MSGGDIAKIAIPMAATVASGGLLAPALAPSLGAVAAPIVAGAVGGAAGSAITGGDPLTGAALGGIGGGITGGSFGSIFGSGADAAASGIGQAGAEAGAEAGVNPVIGQAFDSAGNSVAINSPEAVSFGTSAPGVMTGASLAPVAPATLSDTALQGVADNALANPITAMTNYAKANPMSVIGSGIGGYMTSGSGNEAPQPLAREERKINNVAPLKREQLAIDPNAFYGIGGARSGYVKANPNTVYLADGGKVRDKSEKQTYRENAMESLGRLKAIGYPAATRYPGLNEDAEFIHNRYLEDDRYPYDLKQYVIDEYGADAPVSRAIIQNVRSVRSYARGGSVAPRALGGMYRGVGDGQSDSIPAQVCDGEYFISAPVVSALGRGSNDAGARKLDKLQKTVMAKTYKGGKPPKQIGLGSMRVA